MNIGGDVFPEWSMGYHVDKFKERQSCLKSLSEQQDDLLRHLLDKYLREVHDTSLDKMLDITERFNNVHWKHFEYITFQWQPWRKHCTFKGELIFSIDMGYGEFLYETYWEEE